MQRQQFLSHGPDSPASACELCTPLLFRLPFELLDEILLRLPVEALMRLRCVSKSFQTRISDLRFIKTLMRRRGAGLSKRLVLSWRSSDHFTFKSCSLESVFQEGYPQFIAHHKELRDHPPLRGRVVGSCDGFIMLVTDNSICIWNSFFRSFSKLHDLRFKRRMYLYSVFGLGYDCLSDDLKVVAMFCYKDRINDVVSVGHKRYKIDAKVCTLRERNWRSVQGFELGLIDDVSGIHVDGHICWPYMPNAPDSENRKIVSFSLAHEMYAEVPQPDEVGGFKRHLGVLDGLLCIMYDHGIHRIDFWVMKEFGVRESWSNFVSISSPHGYVWFEDVAPICVSNDGEILIRNGLCFVIYNPISDSLRFPCIGHGSVYIIAKASGRQMLDIGAGSSGFQGPIALPLTVTYYSISWRMDYTTAIVSIC